MSCQCKVCYCSSVQAGNKLNQNSSDSTNPVRKVKFESDAWSNSVQIYPFNIDLVPKIIRKKSKCIECNQDATVNYLDSNKVSILPHTIKSTTNNQTKPIPIIIRELVNCKQTFQNSIQAPTQTQPQTQIQIQSQAPVLPQIQNQFQTQPKAQVLLKTQTQTQAQAQIQTPTPVKPQNTLQTSNYSQPNPPYQCNIKAQNHFHCNHKPNLISQTPYETIISIPGELLKPSPRKFVIEILPETESKSQEILTNTDGLTHIIVVPKPDDPPVPSQKNIILNWEKRNCAEIKTNIKNLGVESADPNEYAKKYGPTLISAVELPEIASQAKTEHGYLLAADYKPNYFNSLEGDLHALTLIDLDKEGLSEYKYLVDDSLKKKNSEKQL